MEICISYEKVISMKLTSLSSLAFCAGDIPVCPLDQV